MIRPDRASLSCVSFMSNVRKSCSVAWDRGERGCNGHQGQICSPLMHAITWGLLWKFAGFASSVKAMACRSDDVSAAAAVELSFDFRSCAGGIFNFGRPSSGLSPSSPLRYGIHSHGAAAGLSFPSAAIPTIKSSVLVCWQTLLRVCTKSTSRTASQCFSSAASHHKLFHRLYQTGIEPQKMAVKP